MPENILSDKERALRSRIFAEMNIVRIRLEKRVRRLWRDINGPNAPTPAILYEHARLTKILAELKTEMDIASLKLAGVTAKVQEKAIRTATDSLNIDLAAFDAKATEALIGFGGLDTKYPLAAMYRRIGKPLAQKVESALVFGVVSGATNHEIAREVRGIMQTTTAHALTIARTETNNAYREASRIAIAKSKQFDGYMWIAALDLRTCPICWRYHGQIFNAKQKFYTHPNCRCTLVAVSPDMEPVETGPQAFAKLTDAQKRTILGKGKFELYKAGYALEQMTGVTTTAYGHSPAILDLDTISKKKPLQALETLENGMSSQPIGPKEQAKPKTQPANNKETVAGFPPNLNALIEVKSLGGSTGAKLVQDSTGRQFVLKGGASEDHIQEEYLADTVYQAFGVPVPKTKLYVDDGGRVYKLSEFIDGKPLNQLTGSAFEKAKAELQKDFHIDALLSNRDVIGLSQDNILVDKSGKVWRIDNGSSFRFRAQGGSKEYDGHLSDLWTLRDSKVNAQSAQVFSGIKIYDLAKRMETASTAEMQARIVAMVPADLKPAFSSRFDQMRDVAKYAREFETNDWADQSYTDEVLKHVVGLRKAGITGRLPKKLEAKRGAERTHLYDENGYKFDSLRRRVKFGKMIPDLFEDYMRANGGNPDVIAEWQSNQAGHSWNSKAQGFKFFVGTKLTAHAQQDVFWRSGRRDEAQAAYEDSVRNFGRETVERSHAQMKALVMELLEHTELPNVDRNARTVRLVRTEAIDVVAQYGLVKNSKLEQKIVRGLAESYSLVRRAAIHGSEITVQDVAFTDIHGLYILNRAGYSGDTGAFLGDGENEVTALWRHRKHVLRYIKPSELRAFGFEP